MTAGAIVALARKLLTQQVSGALRANAASAGQLVGGVAAKRDEIWHLLRIDAVTFPDFGWTDARDLTAAQRMQDCRRFGGKLKCVPITARDQRRPATPLLRCDRSREKVIRLVTGGFRICKAARRHEFRQCLKLIQQGIVKLTPTLICGKFLVPLGGYLQCIPGDNHCPRPFFLKEPQEEIREADDGAGTFAEI